MNIEDIKVGETYNVRVTVTGFNLAKNAVAVWACGGHPCYFPLEDFSPISPENGIKNTETAPKYDPNRLFRKGDKVRVVEWNGRKYYDSDHGTRLETGCLAEIWEDEKDEQEEGYVSVIFQEYIRSVPPCYLELVSPIEELEISRVFNDIKMGAWIVTKDNFTHAYFPYRMLMSDNIANSIQEAKAAAEAERDRLNAEWRKEQK